MSVAEAHPETSERVETPSRLPAGTEPQPRRWTAQEYYELAKQGMFAGQRVQLIDGEIIQMAPQGHEHYRILSIVAAVLQEAYGPGFWVRIQGPLSVNEKSEPEPDVAVVAGSIREYTGHPTTAILAVEVADTSLHLDRRKAALYAAAGVGEFWIIDLGGRRVEVHRRPLADARAEFGAAYAERLVVGMDEKVTLPTKPGREISVRRLFE